MNNSKEKVFTNNLEFNNHFTPITSWKFDVMMKIIDFLNMFHKCLKGIKARFIKQKKCEDMTVEEFCKEMNCTTEYFKQLCSDIKQITSYSDEECIKIAKATFFGNDMQDIDAETANKILQETMEKYNGEN